jgi:hypothetical protein
MSTQGGTTTLPCEGAVTAGTNLQVLGRPLGLINFNYDPRGHFDTIRGNGGPEAGLGESMIPRASVVMDAGGNVLVSFYIQEFTQHGLHGLGQFDMTGLPSCTRFSSSGQWTAAPINQRPRGLKFARYYATNGDITDLSTVVDPPGADNGWKLGGVF